ncbi:sulfatase-like hydrolase/transferase [Nucisporomicrobium flavum]|uniref:sulfatase-like hydrolase/transferase n=1 Tax=Nucisporomicrobium flavum TaxID=2785915 RepID=UPI0018F58606|nr:sulfatase [Nucisporomicrobium flavum]
MGLRYRVGVLAVVAVLGLAGGCTSRSGPGPVTPSSGAATPAAAGAVTTTPAAGRPNIVLVLTDDLSMNLVRYMPHVLAMQRRGASFANYTVTDSLCCPSRASMLTGKFPHNTGIFTNHGADGGFRLFHRKGLEKSTFATDLQAAGYRTAFFGKYLNEYQPKGRFVPPGWTDWHAGGNAYRNFDYDLNENGQVRHYGTAPADYLTDVVGAKASAFIRDAAAARTPFLVEVATYAPHSPYTPAPRDARAFPGLTAPRSPAFEALPSDAPAWLAGRAPLGAQQRGWLDVIFRQRVQAVQAVDRMVASLQRSLSAAGVAGSTMLVFTSDNGYHLGEYRLAPGKQTAFDTDVRVPLVVSGPGVPAGRVVREPVTNIDLRPTFGELAGASVPADVDGRSFVPLLAGAGPVPWRKAALVEHHHPDPDPRDPDSPSRLSGNPPDYAALRTATYTYVEYADGGREFYNRASDPYQLRNVAGRLSPARAAALHAALKGLTTCHGGAACQVADRAG